MRIAIAEAMLQQATEGMCPDPESEVVIVHAGGSFVALRGAFELPWPILG